MIFIIKLLCFLIRLIPVRIAGAIGAGLGRLFYLIDGRHRRIILKNLKRIYPAADPAWRIRIAHESFAELGRTSFELPHVFLRSPEFLRSRISFEGLDASIDAIESGKGVIFTGFHMANWEITAMAFSLLGYPSEMIYRPLRNPDMDKLLSGWRERFGHHLHARDENIRWIPKALRQGKSLSLLVDQHLSNGVPVPFLGHEAQTTVMPALYARRLDTPIIAGILHREGRDFRFRLELVRIEFPEKSEDGDQDLVRFSQTINDTFAPAIHARPECWLWLHRRWLYLDEQEQT